MAITVQEAQVIFSADGMRQVQTEAAKASSAMSGMTSAAGKVMGGLKGIGSALGGLGGMLGALGGTAAVGGMVKMASDAETLGVQMKVLTGSADTAKNVMADINRFAAETPFESMEISTAARQLLSFGGNADTVVDELRMLGDLAAGTGQPLGELAELYGKAKVQGRLFGEDINQLTGRGIPIIGALAKEFGVSESEVKKLVEQGKIGFPEMQRALAGMTGPGGKFAGMMSEMSQTTAGKFSTFVDNVKLLGVELGSQVLPYANQFLDWGIAAVGNISGIGEAFGSILSTAGEWFTATQDYFSDIGIVTGALIGDMENLWAGLFEDIPNYAKAAFDWISVNSKIAMDNIAAGASNMWAKMEQKSRQLGEEIAFALGMSDEVLTIPEPTMQAMQEFQGFETPQTSAATQSVMDNINAQLAQARAEREAARSDADTATAEAQALAAGGAAAQANQAFVSQAKTAAGSEKLNVQRANAAKVFEGIQDTLAKKSVDIGKQTLDVQKEALTAAQQTAQATAALAAGGIPTVAILG